MMKFFDYDWRGDHPWAEYAYDKLEALYIHATWAIFFAIISPLLLAGWISRTMKEWRDS